MDSSSPLPLIPQNSAFPQQGAWNWDNLAVQTSNFIVRIIKRCAEAGVETHSVLVGHAVAKNFPLSERGRKNIKKSCGLAQVSGWNS